MIALAIFAGLLGMFARIAVGHAAKASGRVDHYYWMLAAAAYRAQRGFPVYIRNKYLMEDEAQGYPPMFGLLLGRWRLGAAGMAAMPLLEAAQMAVLAIGMRAFGAAPATIALAVTLYAAAPVLVTYNTQLNSRSLGDLWLFALLAAEASAVMVATEPGSAWLLWCVAAVLTAFVIMTHKMTLQLYAVLLLPWSWALGSPLPLLAAGGGAGIYLLLVGRRYAWYQIRTHVDIVRFWQRNWRLVGAHQFRQSPVYGDRTDACATCLHQPGLRGALRHARVVASYVPLVLVLPLASLVADAWPPAWLIVWVASVYAWAAATLFVPGLKRFGGGHLYVFNAAAPAAMWVGWLPDSRAVAAVLGAGVALTAASLVIAWRIVRGRPATLDDQFQEAVAFLAARPKGRVAVFPLQGAEAVAWATHHAVLWGAHGYGFENMEGFFPVLTRPLGEFLRKYDINWVLSSDQYWPTSADRLRSEGVAADADTLFGHWRVTCVTTDAAAVRA